MAHAITKREFKQWLDDRGMNVPVGRRNSPGACPVANFLKTKYPYVDAVNPRRGFRLKSEQPGTYRPLPQWVSKVIIDIDNDPDSVQGSLITNRTVLNIVERY